MPTRSLPAQPDSAVVVSLDGGTVSDAVADHTAAPVEPRHRWYLPVKVLCEGLVGAMLLVAAVPFILLAAVATRLTSRGPIFYLQTRLGKDGRPFRLIKIRTMVHNAEALTGPVWAARQDARVTAVGRVLRDTHIDEFPQLLNVVCGRMSLIGPRPERPEFAHKLEWDLPRYAERLRIRPGITGLAQLVLPPDSTIDDVRRKLMHDLYYVRHVNPWLDLRIFVFTAWYLTRELGRFFWRLVDLPGAETVERRLRGALSPDDHVLPAVAGNGQHPTSGHHGNGQHANGTH